MPRYTMKFSQTVDVFVDFDAPNEDVASEIACDLYNSTDMNIDVTLHMKEILDMFVNDMRYEVGEIAADNDGGEPDIYLPKDELRHYILDSTLEHYKQARE